tara:strand:- start:131 stop:352 length:222 start_codon:yes stop_codon:yes gene_type:complete
MKFIKTVNLWAAGVQDMILKGELILQPGQWVQCGQGKKSRFVSAKKSSLWVAHWQGTSKASNQRFKTLLKASK